MEPETELQARRRGPVTQQISDGGEFNWGSFASDTLTGAATGLIGGAVAGAAAKFVAPAAKTMVGTVGAAAKVGSAKLAAAGSAAVSAVPSTVSKVTSAVRNAVSKSTAAKPGAKVPAVEFSRSRAPGIAGVFDDAVQNGAPTRLNRVDKMTRDVNRTSALRGHPNAPPGHSLDEYPFASSAQGGSGSVVRAVPVEEQNYQGGVLSSFYRMNTIQPGDPFDVVFGPS